MKILLPVLALALSACVSEGSRTKTLLGECREQNREHVRLLKEYQKRDETSERMKPYTRTLGDGSVESYDGCNWKTCYPSGFCIQTSIYCGAPEQTFGNAEMGTSGW